MHQRRRSYTAYSVACGAVWAAILGGYTAASTAHHFHTVLLVFAGWVIAWVSGTIARYVYPPPKRWHRTE